YVIKNNALRASASDLPQGVSGSILHEAEETYRSLLERWLRMLEAPFPNYRRVAMDIEVHSPIETRVPDPTEAEYRVICASLSSSENTRRVLVLRRTDSTANDMIEQADFEVDFYDREEDLIAALFSAMNSYPFVLTFNGDDFDLRYLFNRALRLGFTREQI